MTGYAFGDGVLAARRLELVAAVFDMASRAFLERFPQRAPQLAVDLGCGPGHTTLLLHSVMRPGRTLGLDQSAAFLDLARTTAPPGVAFAQHDVTTVPFPQRPVDVAYCRFVVTHLPDPTGVLARWATQLAPGGLLLVDEVEGIHTEHPALRAYLGTVAALLGARGHRLDVGPLLDALPDPEGLERAESRVVELAPPVRLVGEMFRLNLDVWRQNPLATQITSPAVLDEIADGLAALARGDQQGTITWELRQMAFEAVPSFAHRANVGPAAI